MSIIELDSSAITLVGVILSSTVSIHNPHKLLAVIFELEMDPEFLEIEPKRGMIMAEERKVIKMRCKSEYLSSIGGLERKSHALLVRASYFSEYNKKIMAKNGLRGWSVISRQLQEIKLPIYFNFSQEIERIKADSRNSSLKRSRRMNSFEKFRESSLKKSKNSRLNDDLDFIFRNQQFKKAYQSNLTHSDKHNQGQQDRIKTSPQFYHNTHQKLNEVYSPPKDSLMSKKEEQFEYKIKIPSAAKENRVNQKQQRPQTSQPPSRKQYSRNFELVILAAIAAVCFALGQTLG